LNYNPKVARYFKTLAVLKPTEIIVPTPPPVIRMRFRNLFEVVK